MTTTATHTAIERPAVHGHASPRAARAAALAYVRATGEECSVFAWPSTRYIYRRVGDRIAVDRQGPDGQDWGRNYARLRA